MIDIVNQYTQSAAVYVAHISTTATTTTPEGREKGLLMLRAAAAEACNVDVDFPPIGHRPHSLLLTCSSCLSLSLSLLCLLHQLPTNLTPTPPSSCLRNILSLSLAFTSLSHTCLLQTCTVIPKPAQFLGCRNPSPQLSKRKTCMCLENLRMSTTGNARIPIGCTYVCTLKILPRTDETPSNKGSISRVCVHTRRDRLR